MSEHLDPETSQPGSDDDESDSPGGVDRTLVVILIVTFAIICVVIAFAARRGCVDECDGWQDQVQELDEHLSAYVRDKGPGRTQRLQALGALEFPCAKVARARDLCVTAYTDLERAEGHHRRAKKLLTTIEEAIKALDPEVRPVAEGRLLGGKTLAALSRELDLPLDEVRRRYTIATKALEPEDIPRLHQQFESALSRSDDLLRAADRTNSECDATFKRLLAESGR